MKIVKNKWMGIKPIFVVFLLVSSTYIVTANLINKQNETAYGKNSLICSLDPIMSEDISEKKIIWDNGEPSTNWILILSQFDSVLPFNAQVADDFIFEEGDTIVTGISWWGNFWGVGDPFDPVDFNIYFYADDGSGSMPTGAGMDNPESTALSSYFLQGVPGFNDSGQRLYSIELPTSFTALQGEKYWLVMQAVFDILPKWGRVTNDGAIYLEPSVYGCPLLGDPYWTDLGIGDVAWYLTGCNNPPETPTIDGPTEGTAGEEYTYEVCSTDPDGDDIIYCVDFGDETGEVCVGPFPSGTYASLNHTWVEEGTYSVKVKATDTEGAVSDWATLEVVMPVNKNVNNFWLWFFFEKIIFIHKVLEILL